MVDENGLTGRPPDQGSHMAPAQVPPEVADSEVPIHRGQYRMARRLARSHANRLRYVHNHGWFVWDGRRWREDRRGEATRVVLQELLRDALVESMSLGKVERDRLRADVRRCESATGVDGLLRLARALPPFATVLDELDADPYLLNTQNGTLDLQTGQLRAHDPKDLITKVTGCGYEWRAQGPAFDQFCSEILPDPEVLAFVQRVLGLGLVGKVIEHMLPVFTGIGRNGKSTLINVVRLALGDYGIEAEPDLLMARDSPHPTGTMDLRGARIAVCQESDEGRRLATSTVKRLTGGDSIRARRMRADFEEFVPSHTVLMVTNHKPRVPGDDPALWRRLLVVPFDVVVPEPDPRLPERLALELPAVLAWMVGGFTKYQTAGLVHPTAVQEATDAYRSDSDTIGRFLADRTESGHESRYVRASELFASFQAWCSENGERSGRQNEFSQDLERRGIEKVRRNVGQFYTGISLTSDDGE